MQRVSKKRYANHLFDFLEHLINMDEEILKDNGNANVLIV